MRSRHWSNTKFADWVRGTPSPSSASWEGWNEWEARAEAAHPIRYWITEKAFDQVQSFIYWPVDKLYDVKYYVVNRWVDKTHAMTSRLPRGKYHEFDTRMMHSMFDSLVDFVEVEQAWNHTLWSDEARKEYKTPWYAHGWLRTRTWRCPEAGIQHLNWASKLTRGDDGWCPEDDPQRNLPTPQALAAKETLALYFWWTEDRPNRIDPSFLSGWDNLCSTREPKSWRSDKTPEEQEAISAALDRMYKIEADYDAEDEQQMIRLVKLRKHLWT